MAFSHSATYSFLACFLFLPSTTSFLDASGGFTPPLALLPDMSLHTYQRQAFFSSHLLA